MSWETIAAWVAFLAGVVVILAEMRRGTGKLDAKIDRLDERLSTRIDGVEQKIDAVEQRLEAKIDGIEQRLDQKIDTFYQEFVDFRFETREEFGRVHAQLVRHEERLALWERFIWARTTIEFADQPRATTSSAASSTAQSPVPTSEAAS